MNLKRKGKKIEIRPLEAKDFEAWSQSILMMNKKSKNKWDILYPTSEIPTKKEFNEYLKRQNQNIAKDNYYNFGVFLNNNTLVGRVLIMDVSRGYFQNASLSYRIYSDYWRLGYGKESIGLVLKIAFKELKLHRIEAGIDPTNKRSIGLVKSCGLKKEGYSPKRIFFNNEWVGLTLYAIHSEDMKIKCHPVVS
jgi:ribosomal-protein-alanine N-acetyltransferase